ncbi:MAG: hypothetical protein ACK5JM_14335 [Rhodoblastus sp.]
MREAMLVLLTDDVGFSRHAPMLRRGGKKNHAKFAGKRMGRHAETGPAGEAPGRKNPICAAQMRRGMCRTNAFVPSPRPPFIASLENYFNCQKIAVNAMAVSATLCAKKNTNSRKFIGNIAIGVLRGVRNGARKLFWVKNNFYSPGVSLSSCDPVRARRPARETRRREAWLRWIVRNCTMRK